MMNYIIDAVYVIIALITVIIFTKRGLVASVFKYGRTIFASIISYALGPAVSKLIYDRVIYDGIYRWVLEKVQGILRMAEAHIDIDSLIDGLPFVVKQFVNPEELKQIYGETIANIEQSALSFTATVSSPLASVISNMISYVLVFLIALLVLLIFGKLLDLIVHLPILRTINSVLGFLVGIGSAFLFLAVITYFLSFLIGLFGNILSLQTLASSSYVFGFFSDVHVFDLH